MCHTLAYFKHHEMCKQQLLQSQQKQAAQHLLLACCRCDFKALLKLIFHVCGKPSLDSAGEGCLQPPVSSKQGRPGHTLPNFTPALKGPAGRLGRSPSRHFLCWPLVLWRSSTILSIMETPFNSWSVVIARLLVCANGLIAGSSLCDEVEGMCNFVLAQQRCGSIRRDGSCSKLCFLMSLEELTAGISSENCD